jgi:hypothetical protein
VDAVTSPKSANVARAVRAANLSPARRNMSGKRAVVCG